jgi:Ca2+-binding EF-hand superfamily protein
MKSIILLSVGIALTLPMCANAKKHQGPTRNPAQYDAAFKRKDKNKDGHLSRDEYIAKAKDTDQSTRNFIKKDKNGDGKVTREEFGTKITSIW